MREEDVDYWLGGLTNWRREPDPNRPSTGADRRAYPRVSTRLAGKIIIGDGFMSPDCLILDLSRWGARVSISGAKRLPPPLALLMIWDGFLFDAAVAWRRGDETGLVFKTHYDLSTEVDPSRRAIQPLWRELSPQLPAIG